MAARRTMLLAGLACITAPAFADDNPPTLVPGSTYHYESVNPDFENSSFFLLYYGSVGPWNIYMTRSSYGDTDYYAEPAYGLDYVGCHDSDVTSPENLAADFEALSALTPGETMNRAANEETVQQRGPTDYTSDYFPGQTFSAHQIKITYFMDLEETEQSEAIFTYTADGQVGLEIDWGEGNKDVLTSYHLATTPAPPLTRERAMELCPVLIDYLPED